MRDWLRACWAALTGGPLPPRPPGWHPPPEGELVERRNQRIAGELETLRTVTEMVEQDRREERRRNA